MCCDVFVYWRALSFRVTNVNNCKFIHSKENLETTVDTWWYLLWYKRPENGLMASQSPYVSGRSAQCMWKWGLLAHFGKKLVAWVESARKHLWDSVVGAKATFRKLTILSNTFPKRGSWIKRDLSFYPDVCFAVFQIWETRNTNISQRYSRTSANGHLPTTATYFSSRRTKNPYIDSRLKPLYNGHFLVPKVAVVERFDCTIW